MSDTSTYVVTHPKLYLSVDGKLQHVERGTEIPLTDKQVGNEKDGLTSLGKKVVAKGKTKTVELGVAKDKSK